MLPSKNRIKAQIESVFKNIDERPLFYIESGSRLWGIASPDSDFDVRGFHLQSKRQYFDFKKQRGIIEIMDGDFDFVSYDLDKMFGLLAKSNPTVFEWVRSNIVYFNKLPDWSTFQKELIANLDFKALFHHYLSLANRSIILMESGRKFTYKTAFYCIRGLLSADLASRQIIPELLIDDLFLQFEKNNPVLQIAKDSLERKKQGTEKEGVVGSQKQIILTAIKEFSGKLKNQAPTGSRKREKINEILTEYSISLKAKLYQDSN